MSAVWKHKIFEYLDKIRSWEEIPNYFWLTLTEETTKVSKLPGAWGGASHIRGAVGDILGFSKVDGHVYIIQTFILKILYFLSDKTYFIGKRSLHF